MYKPLSRRAAFVLSAGAIAFAGTAALPAQAAAIPGWRVNTTFPVRSGETLMTTADAVSARDAWSAGVAVNAKGTSFTTMIRHWNGKSWRPVALPAKVASAWTKAQVLQASIGASSPSNVWIFGDDFNGAYLRLNGTHWSIGKLPGANLGAGKLVEIDAVRVFSRSNVWAFGAATDESGTTQTITPYAAHFNGSRWTITNVPGNSPITSVSAPSPAGVWAVAGTPPAGTLLLGAAGQQTVLHWTAKTGWQQPAQPVLPAGSHLTSVLVESGKVIVGGSRSNSAKGRTPLTVTWNGTAWSAPSAGPSSTAKWELAGLAPDGRGGTWALGQASNRESAKLWHLAGGKWTVVTPAFGRHAWILFQLTAVPHSASVWAAGALREGKTAAGLIALAGPKP
jgi:hypothetical protein